MPKQTRVLGTNTLQNVWDDMLGFELPTWVDAAPPNAGSALHGKLSADHWKAFCMINLVYTTVRLWGGLDRGSVERAMLDNYMDLATAVKLGNMREMFDERRQQFMHHALEHLRSLKVIFPGHELGPYQHLSLHFVEFLERFGPVHAWRCFPFERYNYLLQQIPTNEKWGESTSFSSFALELRLWCRSR